MRRHNVEPPKSMDATASWLEALDDEDLMFVRRFVLASGSLKSVARSYEISYPTVRLRLDRLIQKIEVVEAHHEVSPFERRLRLFYAEGRLDLDAVQALLEAHHAALDATPGAALPTRDADTPLPDGESR